MWTQVPRINYPNQESADFTAHHSAGMLLFHLLIFALLGSENGSDLFAPSASHL